MMGTLWRPASRTGRGVAPQEATLSARMASQGWGALERRGPPEGIRHLFGCGGGGGTRGTVGLVGRAEDTIREGACDVVPTSLLEGPSGIFSPFLSGWNFHVAVPGRAFIP